MVDTDPAVIEAWRLACEARWVLALPTLEERRAWMKSIRAARGDAGYEYLAEAVLREHALQQADARRKAALDGQKDRVIPEE